MNKNKLLISLSLLFLFLLCITPQNVYAKKCYKLSTQYQIFLNPALAGKPLKYNIEIFRNRVPIKKIYPATIVDVDTGTIFEGAIGRFAGGGCNTVGTQLPVVIIDDIGLDGDIGDTIQVDYACAGRLNRSSGITGLCELNQFIPQVGQIVKDNATFIATTTSNQRIRIKDK